MAETTTEAPVRPAPPTRPRETQRPPPGERPPTPTPGVSSVVPRPENLPKTLEVSVASAKHRIATDEQEGEEQKEHESKLGGRRRTTEEKEEWEKTFSPRRLVRRIWQEGIQQRAFYAREKATSQQMTAEGGLEKTAPYGFQREVRGVAQKLIDKENAAKGRLRLGTRAEDFMRQATLTQRQLHKQEVSVMQNLRLNQQYHGQDLNRITDVAERDRAQKARDFVTSKPEHKQLADAYQTVLSGQFQASEGLAQRLGSELGPDALRTAIGEKKAGEQVQITGDLKNFFNDEVIVPLLKEGLTRPGGISEDTLLRTRLQVQDVFMTQRFAQWRENLPPDVQKHFDVSLSYGTDIIPMIQNKLLPELQGVKDHLQAGDNLKNYANDLVLNVNVGTLKSGEENELNETKLEKWVARSITNEGVMAQYRETAAGRGPNPLHPDAFTNCLEPASKRAQILARLGPGHVAAGLLTGLGIYGLQRGAGLGGRVATSMVVPFLGGGAVAGAIRAGQERTRFTREHEQHQIETSRGDKFDSEAKRRNKMEQLTTPTVNIQDSIRAMVEGQRRLQAGNATPDDMLRIIGSLADRKARRTIMDTTRGMDLYKTVSNLPMEEQKTQLELANARLRVALGRHFDQGQLPELRRRLGITSNDNLDGIIHQMTNGRIKDLQTGTGIDPNLHTRLGLTRIQEQESIDMREKAFKSARRAAMVKQGAGTAGAVIFGTLVSQELIANGQRLFGSHPRTPMLERMVGVGEAKSHSTAAETILRKDAPMKQSDILGRTVNIPEGTHWVKHGGGRGLFDLVADKDPNKVLVKDGHFNQDSKFVYDHDNSQSGIDHQIHETMREHTVKKPVLGEGGLWNKNQSTVTREWYGNNTQKFDYNELKFHTWKDGNRIALVPQNMQESWQTGLSPERYYVPGEMSKDQISYAFSLPGDESHPLIVHAPGGAIVLDPTDTNPLHTYELGNGKKIQAGELAKMLVNHNAYQGLPNGDIATELNHHEDVFNLGKDGAMGTISLGEQRGNTFQSFATIHGSGKMPDSISTTVKGPSRVDISGIDLHTEAKVDNLPGTPFIPLLWPRRPLEAGEETEGEAVPLASLPGGLEGGYGYGYGYGGNERLGLLNWGDFPARRSEALRNNPDARLDERTELRRYITSWNQEYRDELESMDQTVSTPMTEACRAAITIPAYEEGKNIFRTLEQFLGQERRDSQPLNPSAFEIVIFDNHPASVAKDNTETEIQRFKTEHPEMHITYAHKEWGDGDSATVGNARKYAEDLAVLRGEKRVRQDGELILVNGDADVESVSKHYIADYIDEFDKDERIDAIGGRWNLPDWALQNPNLRAAQRFWYGLDRLIQRDAIGEPGDRNHQSVPLIGRNSAVRASMYAAIGGGNPNAKLVEDLELGWMISSARNWDASRFKYINRSELVSNPRRFLAAEVQGIPLVNMYGGFHENPGIRQLDARELITQLPDTFSRDRLQNEMDAIWQSGKTGQYAFIGDKFPAFFARSANLLGVNYTIENDHVRITNTDRLEATFATGRTEATPTPETAVPSGHELTSPGTLLTDLNNRLEQSTETAQNFEVTPQVLAEFVRTTPTLFGQDIGINTLNMNTIDNNLEINGVVSYKGRDIPINRIQLGITDQGGLTVIGNPEYDFGNLNAVERRVAPGIINRRVRELNNRLRGALNTRVPQGWQVQRFQLNDGKLGINFGRDAGTP